MHAPSVADWLSGSRARPFQTDPLPFARHCRTGNLSPKTTQTYTESAGRLAEYLAAQGMPSDIGAIRREHIESFITDQLGRHKATTAHNRYRGVQAFFRWALDEGLVKDSPMARMRPPRLPEAPPPVLREWSCPDRGLRCPPRLAIEVRRKR
jgi:site-specific recombinase XerD